MILHNGVTEGRCVNGKFTYRICYQISQAISIKHNVQVSLNKVQSSLYHFLTILPNKRSLNCFSMTIYMTIPQLKISEVALMNEFIQAQPYMDKFK